MKRLMIVSIAALALAACGPTREHVRDEVRQVEVGDTLVDDGYGAQLYVPGELFSSDTPELYVDVLDVASQQTFRIDLGTECAQFPLPKGQRFLAKFDVTRDPKVPQELYMAPKSDQLYGYLCG